MSKNKSKYDCGKCTARIMRIRGCPKSKENHGNKPNCMILEIDLTSMIVMKLMKMIEAGLVGRNDMDAWHYNAAEYAMSERYRLMQKGN